MSLYFQIIYPRFRKENYILFSETTINFVGGIDAATETYADQMVLYMLTGPSPIAIFKVSLL